MTNILTQLRKRKREIRLNTEVKKLLSSIKQANRVVIYGSGKRARLILPVCLCLKDIENIEVVVTELKAPIWLDEIQVKEVKDIELMSSDLVLIAVGESYWNEIGALLGERGLSGSNIIELSDNVIMSAKKYMLFEQCRHIGIDVRLLSGFAKDDMYSLFWTEDFRDKTKSIKNKIWEIANEESAEYVMKHMMQAKEFSSKEKYHDWIVDYLKNNVKETGLNLEFGVAAGVSLRKFSAYTQDPFWGFDSFEGLPEGWMPGYEEQRFDYKGTLPQVGPNVKLMKGWFDKTLPVFVKEQEKELHNINFIHIDCDLYSSTKTVFDYLGKYIKKGTVIAFDEYFNYPGWKENEYKAFKEWKDEYGIQYEYLAYVENYSQVCIRIL